MHGNITCKSLKIDPTTVIVGSINVNPFAPSKVDPAGNIVEDSEVRTTSQRPLDPCAVTSEVVGVDVCISWCILQGDA